MSAPMMASMGPPAAAPQYLTPPAAPHHSHAPAYAQDNLFLTRPTAYQPSTQLSRTHLEMEGSVGVYQHFHAPFNSANRFLASATDAEEMYYRDLPRRPPPPFTSPDRPPSAPQPPRYTHEERARLTQAVHGMTMTADLTSATGAPSYLVPAVMDADLVDGSPLTSGSGGTAEGTEAWRIARVQAYSVPPHSMGYGEGGAKPFHQDYRHYKYYGFAGRGAKTSWAHNPKFSKLNIPATTLMAEASAAGAEALPAPLVDEAGNRRSMTATEKALVKEYSMHSYGADGVPSQRPASSPSRTARGTHMTAGQLTGSRTIDPYASTIDLVHPSPKHSARTPPKGSAAAAAAAAARRAPSPGGDGTTARVLTYRTPAPSGYTLEHNASPNMGSASPFTQRYAHYKQYGFAGKGATSAWARNPKYAVMADGDGARAR